MEISFMTKKQLLFEEEVKLTEVKAYGYSWQEFAEGKTPIPAEGARFDIYFEGEVFGDRINGTIQGVDYLEVRADGRLSLDLHASITTDDGVEIKVKESGINNRGELRLNMNFHTVNTRYSWLNQTQVWGIGTVDFQTGAVKIKGYLI